MSDLIIKKNGTDYKLPMLAEHYPADRVYLDGDISKTVQDKIDELTTESSGSLVSYMQSGFTGNDVTYYRKGNIVTIRSNGAAPNATGGGQYFLALPSSFKAKIQTFAVVTEADGTLLGLAYISDQTVTINVSAIGFMYFSLTYQSV